MKDMKPSNLIPWFANVILMSAVLDKFFWPLLSLVLSKGAVSFHFGINFHQGIKIEQTRYRWKGDSKHYSVVLFIFHYFVL